MHPEICKHFIELTNFIKEVMEDRTEEDFHMFWHRSRSTSFQPSSFDENKYNYGFTNYQPRSWQQSENSFISNIIFL